MSYEPDTQDRATRALKEEINKIREEQFSKAFGTGAGASVSTKSGGSIGGGLPTTGTASFSPSVIRLTKDTGVIKRLSYKLLTPTKEFAIGETVTGSTSGATAKVGDIDITGALTGVLFWVPSSVVGTFTANETINGNINGQAKADLAFLITQIGRGHLNAGSASIIAEAVGSPAEIHFIDNAKQNGQFILLRAQNGQTIRVRRAITQDGNTGNIDLDNSFNIIENAIVILQYQAVSDVTPHGGWVPALSTISSGGTNTITSGIDFPILYPKEDLGDQGSTSVSLLLNQANGHYKRIRMIGDISLQFNSDPPALNGFKFYVLLVQDGVGGHNVISVDSAVKNGASILTQIDPNANAQTLLQFVTADGGVTYHGQVIQPSGGGDASQWSFFKALTDVNMDTRDIMNIDKLRFFGFGGFSFPVDATMQAISTSPVGLQFNVPLDQKYKFYESGFEQMVLSTEVDTGVFTLRLTNGNIADVHRLAFHESPGFMAFIRVNPNTLIYTANGVGAVHSFVIDDDEASPNMEMRLNVNKSNRNLDLVTNDIINLDQAQFDPNGGFVGVINHGQRRISGGNTGINMNVPHLKTVKLWFENAGLTNSDLKYEFKQDGIYMYTNNIFDVQGIFFPNAGSIIDLAGFGLEFLAGVTPPFGTGNPQTMNFRVRGSAPSYPQIDMFVLDGLAHNTTNGGGMKMYTDLNMQTQNIHNVDLLNFNSNNGIVGGNQFAMARDTAGNALEFNFPTGKKFSFRSNDVEFMSLTPSELKMIGYPTFPSDSRIVAQQFNFNAPHSQGTAGMLDGYIRLVVNGPNNDVWVATGGVLKNLSTLGSTSFINPLFTADGDLNMGTFNIFNLDVLRFVVDGGVIGFGTYGIGVDAGNNSLRYSTPANKGHLFQINLDDVVSIGSSGIQVIPNTTFANPNIIAREFLLQTHSIGTGSMVNGAFRKLGNDVFVRTGNTTVNLTTLVSGGSASLWANFPAVSQVDLANNPLLNFQAWSNAFGQSWIADGFGVHLNVPSGDIHTFDVNNVTKFSIGGVENDSFDTLNMNSNPITNVFNNAVFNGTDVANKNYVLSVAGGGSFVTTNTDQFSGLTGSKTWDGTHLFNGALTTFNGSVQLGNSTADTVLFNARILADIIPTALGNNLGDTTRRWDLFGGLVNTNSLFVGSGATVTTISTSQFANSTTGLMTSSAVQLLVASAGGGDAFLNATQDWFGVNTFNNTTNFGVANISSLFVTDASESHVAGAIATTAIFGTAVNLTSTQTISGVKTFTQPTFNITGNLNQDGGQIGFRGSAPTSKVTVPTAFLSANWTTLLNALRAMGLIG